MLEIYTIYDHPSDYPHSWVVRRWHLNTMDLSFIKIADSLDEAREHIPAGFVNVGRHPNDDSVVYESWI